VQPNIKFLRLFSLELAKWRFERQLTQGGILTDIVWALRLPRVFCLRLMLKNHLN